MTKNRRKILELISDVQQPLCAGQIHERLEKAVDMATVYRALRNLEDNAYLSSFIMDCSERGVEKYYSVLRDKHLHYMHCESCHDFVSIQSCPLSDNLVSIENETGFQVKDHILTIKGICSSCRSNGVL